MLAFRQFMISFVAALFILLQVQAIGLFESDSFHRLQQRQAAINGNVCATLDLALLGITLAKG